ncbi:MAG: Lrp/AsnC family transcriptional regulator [Clostridia bacterium]|nr:Lrp/AsnC family transcriptional regulator [Clostridia bacterium]
MENNEKLLKQLEKNGRITGEQLASVLGESADEIRDTIAELEREKVIVGYNALIDWDKTDRELVTALIEVKVTPQRGDGFDRVAARIYQYPEVTSVYLLSGGFDLVVMIEGKTLKEVAHFVSSKLATIDAVTGTATHFVLKKYKDKGVLFEEDAEEDRRILVI